ncbi:unnamed protein product [Cladocopium goreaui]|uniref:Luc7-like protein n=1 Tax=Cladocopium goreaui TaxID=2562237 RepID=A0A9P1CQ94_9DINO|nr:unnamed protein product [Cladocopium goreaui]|mmetsp:Transcript_76238/g.168377  ORF Transcript_76238/g.168377 Transcript_76238/m.168377 type:complete len:326 (+) Transcript_76238:24-1001(+)
MDAMDQRMLKEEVVRLRSEYDSLKAAADEEQAADEILLHDAQLERLRLRTLLDRYVERPPKVEELAERYESEIDELSEELRQLQEENALLAYHESSRAEQFDHEDATPSTSRSHRSPSTRSPRVNTRRTARQVHLQAKETRQCEAKLTSLRRRTRVNEWYLSQLKGQLQETAKVMQNREHRLQELRLRFDQAGEERQRLAEEHVRTQQMLDTERQELVQLHQEALSLREACYLPAQLKKKSSMLTKFLDQEGGRLKLEKHLRGREVVAKLYRSVAQQAPECQAIAGRVKTDMDAAFANLQQLQAQHQRQLQQLHLNLARNAFSPR